jgi:hypothetical protein
VDEISKAIKIGKCFFVIKRAYLLMGYKNPTEILTGSVFSQTLFNMDRPALKFKKSKIAENSIVCKALIICFQIKI